MPDRPADGSWVDKPWGWEHRFAITDRYLGKVIHVNRGEMLSLQYHRQKDETLLVTSGTMDLELENAQGRIETHRLTRGWPAGLCRGASTGYRDRRLRVLRGQLAGDR